MAYSKIEKAIFDIAEPIAKAGEFEIYDIEFVKEGEFYFLRVYVEKSKGINLDECEAFSRLLSEQLDKNDPISQNYYLEVSSPGIERKLKTAEHFARYIGENVDVGLYKAIDGEKQITATLLGYEDKVIRLQYNEEEIQIPQKETTSVKLHFDF
ncbi:MAG: ribosome maturation factor RimP [Oscillospiraceae bacterium]